MNVTLTDERQMVQDSLRRFLSDTWTDAVRARTLAGSDGFSRQVWAGLAELGILGALMPEASGGFGGGGGDIAVVFEELGRAGAVEPVLETLIGARLLAAAGRDVGPLLDGARHVAFAHTEPQGWYDLAQVSTIFDAGRLSGRKAVVVNAEAADILLVTARDPELGVFAVERSAPGVIVQGYPLISGGRAAEVVLDNAPAQPLGIGFGALQDAEAAAIVAQCAETLGAMETAVAMTADYLITRQQFGRPLATFQALQHRMADLWIELEQVRSAVINAAGHFETPERDITLAASKNLVCRAAKLVAEETIQLHGGIAMTQDYALAHFAKRIAMVEHRFGDADWHLERFMALCAAGGGHNPEVT